MTPCPAIPRYTMSPLVCSSSGSMSPVVCHLPWADRPIGDLFILRRPRRRLAHAHIPICRFHDLALIPGRCPKPHAIGNLRQIYSDPYRQLRHTLTYSIAHAMLIIRDYPMLAGSSCSCSVYRTYPVHVRYTTAPLMRGYHYAFSSSRRCYWYICTRNW